MTEPRIDDHERRISSLERADARREQVQDTLVRKVDQIERETRDQTRMLDRIDGGVRFTMWAIPGVAAAVAALWWLFQHLPTR